MLTGQLLAPRPRAFTGGTVPRPAELPVQNDRRDACPTKTLNTTPYWGNAVLSILNALLPKYGDIFRAWTGIPHVDLSGSRRVPVSPPRGVRTTPKAWSSLWLQDLRQGRPRTMRFPRIRCGVTTSYEARENAAPYLENSVLSWGGEPGSRLVRDRAPRLISRPGLGSTEDAISS